MDIDNLVTMANSIGDFFQSMPNPQEARLGIAQHISKFWEPRMREALIAHLADASVRSYTLWCVKPFKSIWTCWPPKRWWRAPKPV